MSFSPIQQQTLNIEGHFLVTSSLVHFAKSHLVFHYYLRTWDNNNKLFLINIKILQQIGGVALLLQSDLAHNIFEVGQLPNNWKVIFNRLEQWFSTGRPWPISGPQHVSQVGHST